MIHHPSFRSHVGRRLLAVSLLVATLLALLLGAAAFAQAPPRSFAEVVDVRVINLEVVVNDKDGVRVSNLRPEDFRLLVDGEEVPVEYFTEVIGGTASVRGDEVAMRTLPALSPGQPVGTSFLVFIDEYFTIPTERNRVLKRMVEQLPMLSPEDRMAVVAYDGKRLDMLSSWSGNIPELTRVFEQAQERSAAGLQREAELRTFYPNRLLGILDGPVAAGRSFADDPAGSIRVGGAQLEMDEEALARRVADQVERVVAAGASALRGFANPPGRKVLLMLSGGWPYNPEQWVVNDIQRVVFSGIVPRADELYRPLLDTANRLSYTIYPVEVQSVATPTSDIGQGDIATAELGRDLLHDRFQDERSTLVYMAEATGGEAILGGARAEALERVVTDTRSYYWIGFTPHWQGDDSSHKVRLTSRVKGLDVRTRTSFSDLSRETEVTMMVESTLMLGDPPTSIPLGVALGEPKKAGRGKVLVPLRIMVPLGALTFLPGEDEWVAETELRIAVLDEDGATAEIPVIPLTFAGPRAAGAEDFSVYDTELKLRRKPHDLVVALYDVASGAILTNRLTFTPAEK